MKKWLGGALRTTFGEENTKEDIDYLVENLVTILPKLQLNT